jgi:hypothetical protein
MIAIYQIRKSFMDFDCYFLINLLIPVKLRTTGFFL